MLSLSGLAFTLALFTALTFTAYGLIARVLARASADPLAFSVLYGVYGALFALPILLFEPWQFGTITLDVLLITFAATVFYGIFQGFEFFARKHLEASRMTVFFQLVPAFVFIGSILLLGESFSIEKFAAIALIIAGNIVAIHRHGGRLTRTGLSLALIAVTALALGYLADKKVFEFYPIALYIIITYLFPSIYLFLFMRVDVSRLHVELRAMSWRLPILGVVSTLGYYLLLKTFSLMDASVAVPVVYTSTILTGLGGIIILKERSNIVQKLLGGILVLAGVILLSR